MLAACSTTEAPQIVSTKGKIDPRYGVAPSPRVVGENDPVPQGGGRFMTGKPYRIGARWFTPMENPVGYEAVGMASWYGRNFHGRRTANGEVFDATALTAAHPTLPLPCYIRITNLDNGRSMTVRVNDRGPYHGRRLIDVSHDTAHMLGFKSAGVAKVKIQYVGPAKLEGSDRNILLASYRGPQDMRPAPTTPAGARDVLIASADRRPADFGWGSAGKPSIAAGGIDLGRSRSIDPQSRPILPASYQPAAAPAKQRKPVITTPVLADARPGAPVPRERPGAAQDEFFLTANAAERAARGGAGETTVASVDDTSVAVASPAIEPAGVDLAAPMPRANPGAAQAATVPFAFSEGAPAPAGHAGDAISGLIDGASVPVPEAAPRGGETVHPAAASKAPSDFVPVPHAAPINSYAPAPQSRFDDIEALLAAEAGPDATAVPLGKPARR